jgi:hypothetical protein
MQSQPIGSSPSEPLECTLQQAADLVSLLHTIAHEWSVPNQRKGRPVDIGLGRALLCDFEGSPCPLLSGPRPLLAAIGSRWPLHIRTSSAPVTSAIARLAADVANDSATASKSSSSSSSSSAAVDVLLLPVGAPPSTETPPQLLIVLSEAAMTPAEWDLALSDVPAGFNGSSSGARFLFPDHSINSSDETGTAASAPGMRARRSRSRAVPPPLHRAALLWRATVLCEPPLWDLRRPVGEVTAKEAAAAAAAVARGVPYSEWFVCATLEVLRPLVRTLFRLPRRKGKSVWSTCVRAASPCFWFIGLHTRGEHFVTQVLSSPDVLLGRMSAHRAAVLAHLGASASAVAGTNAVSGTGAVEGLSATYSGTSAVSGAMGAWPPLLLVDPAAGEGNYTQHLPDGMGRTPALALVETYGWHALLGEPDRYTFSWLSRHFEVHVAAGRATLTPHSVTPLPSAVVAPLYTLDA